MRETDKESSREYINRAVKVIRKIIRAPEELPNGDEAPAIKELFDNGVLTTEELPSTADPRILLRKAKE